MSLAEVAFGTTVCQVHRVFFKVPEHRPLERGLTVAKSFHTILGRKEVATLILAEHLESQRRQRGPHLG